MYVSIRTTIFWNIFILMITAIVLIGLVVFRITEREVLKQRLKGGEGIFFSVRSTVTHILSKNPHLLDTPANQSELQQLVQLLTDRTLFSQIIITNTKHIVLAHSEGSKVGQTLLDADLSQAIAFRDMIKNVRKSSTESSACLIISSPLYGNNNTQVGALKVVFSLKDVEQNIAQSKKMILFYIVFDALVLILFGSFLLTRYLVKPIDKLIRLTDNISQGNFETSLALSDRNEIGKLSASLSRMAEKLNEDKIRVHEHIRALEDKNRELQQAQQEIIQSEKLASVGRLAAGVAHEIGNPIGIILGYLDLLLDHSLDEQQRADYLKRLQRETERINSVIRGLLDYAQPSSPIIEELNINTLIQDTCSLVSYQKGFQQCTINFKLDSTVPPLIADEKQIRQIIINLTLNALDAMPDGGTITYATAAENISGEYHIVFSTTDTGKGIPPEIQDKIFDPFFTTKEPGKGTGLGLSNVQRMVQSLGGRVTVASVPGKGTTFTVIFPCKESK
ncbi:MAG: ATP-binding protein [Proteobacteria bacterium]|nr:ATP-binding protein [Pseudomonadota bacterium]